MLENAKITTLIENRTIVYPKTVKEAVYGLEEELNKKEVTIGSTPDEDAVLWIEPDGDVTTPIYAPNIAQVGQTIVVSAVDENGRPTAWEAVDMPQGGGEALNWRTLVDHTFEEEVTTFNFDRDFNNQPFSVKHLLITITWPTNHPTGDFQIGTKFSATALLRRDALFNAGTFNTVIYIAPANGVFSVANNAYDMFYFTHMGGVHWKHTFNLPNNATSWTNIYSWQTSYPAGTRIVIEGAE